MNPHKVAQNEGRGWGLGIDHSETQVPENLEVGPGMFLENLSAQPPVYTHALSLSLFLIP